MIEENTFREDLYYRLNVAQIYLPPLRERAEDIPLLARFFLERFCHESDLPQIGFTLEALERLSTGYWPGNVRQLQNVVRKAALNARGYSIDEPNIGLLMEEQGRTVSSSVDDAIKEIIEKSEPGEAHQRFLERFESKLLAEAMKQHEGNLSKASEALGISRFTLREKLKSYGLRE